MEVLLTHSTAQPVVKHSCIDVSLISLAPKQTPLPLCRELRGTQRNHSHHSYFTVKHSKLYLGFLATHSNVLEYSELYSPMLGNFNS